MKLPFSTEDFLNVFRSYNTDFWPAPLLFYALAAMILFYASKKYNDAGRVISGILSFFWIWMGVVYHMMYFAPINKAAFFFGVLFVLQGLLFAYMGVIKETISFSISKNRLSVVGVVLVFYALLIYPLTGMLAGHYFPATPSFGLPCPTTIFTLGILLCSDKKPPMIILVIPLLWSVIGFTAAFALGIKEDTALLAAALLFILFNRRKNKKLVHQSLNLK